MASVSPLDLGLGGQVLEVFGTSYRGAGSPVVYGPAGISAAANDAGADANDAGADANDLDGDGHNPLENGGADGTDDADANFPSVSEPWRVDL